MQKKMNIQIIKIYKESFHDVLVHKNEWLRVSAGPVLIVALTALLYGLAYISSGSSLDLQAFITEPSNPTVFLVVTQFVYRITYFIAEFILSINGFRYAILGEGRDRWITLNLNRRLVTLILYTILLGMLIVYLFRNLSRSSSRHTDSF